MEVLKVLAVDDPAVKVYIDKNYNILNNFLEDNLSVEFHIVPWEDYFPTMMKAFSGDVSYDIVMIAGHLWLRDFVEKGYLAPLNYDFEDILPIIAKEMIYNGQTYLSPSFCDGHMIVYYKSIVEKAMNKTLKDVLTVEEFTHIAKVLSEVGYSKPIGLKAHISEILLDALPYLRSSGTDIYTLEDNKVSCHIKEKVEPLKKYLALRKYAPSLANTYGNDQIKEAIAKKEVAMATTWSGQIGEVTKACSKKEDLGFATFDTAWNVTWSFGITNTSDKKEQAKKLLAYLRSKSVDRVVGRYSGAPVRRSSYIEDLEECPWYKVQLKMIEDYATPLVSVKDAGTKNDILYDAIYRAFIDEVSVEDALEQAQAKIEKL